MRGSERNGRLQERERKIKQGKKVKRPWLFKIFSAFIFFKVYARRPACSEYIKASVFRFVFCFPLLLIPFHCLLLETFNDFGDISVGARYHAKYFYNIPSHEIFNSFYWDGLNNCYIQKIGRYHELWDRLILSSGYIFYKLTMMLKLKSKSISQLTLRILHCF